ncbi:MAG: DMT family transporter [Candidatus Eisenbacteria bacterium]|uniref:DMT family transporter n=1 Tax=Eiseniibacteriota bacterium TaxID=2212470 RepID=A0A938BQA0_UNCEI|nr:DMT family transporter [Candidatus Eisenbacteria bacterium]
MRRRALEADALLLVTAAIWGFAFVAQRAGMEHVGPFLFNAVRFGIGALLMLPFALRARPARATSVRPPSTPRPPAGAPSEGPASARTRSSREPGARPPSPRLLAGGLCAGAVLFGGAALQQGGLVHTTAGKAGFITGLYVILVPLLGLFWRQRPGAGGWAGALLALAGLYFLSVRADTGAAAGSGLAMARGDALVFCGAFFWAAHVILIGRISPGLPATALACLQYAVCAVASLAVALAAEEIRWAGLAGAAWPILYSGVLSVGVAYTLQVVAQRRAPPAHAAILMSLEAVFAALGGRLVLQESFGGREWLGCALMLAGMLVSQARTLRQRRSAGTPGRAGLAGVTLADRDANGGVER